VLAEFLDTILTANAALTGSLRHRQAVHEGGNALA
jgi:hypothetical protein